MSFSDRKVIQRPDSLLRKNVIVVVCSILLTLSGCSAAGYLAHAFVTDYVNVKAQYTKLNGHSIAVMVSSSDQTLYKYPRASLYLCKAVTTRLEKNLKNIQLVDPIQIIRFQRDHPYWVAMRYSKLMSQLGVNKLVVISVSAYRVHPPGNARIWKGVVEGNVGVASASSVDPDNFDFSQHVRANYPQDRAVGDVDSSEQEIRDGMVALFSLKAAGLFYDHQEHKQGAAR